MKIQSITPTENLKQNNSSFKASFEYNKNFLKLWRTVAPGMQYYDKFVYYADKFTKMNKDQVYEIVNINEENGVVKILNKSNGVVKEYNLTFKYYNLFTNLLEKLCHDIKSTMKSNIQLPKNNLISSPDVLESGSMFKKDKYGISTQLIERAKTDEELNKSLAYLQRRRNGHNLEIIDVNDNKYSIMSSYVVFNHKNGAISKYELEKKDALRELINRLNRDKKLFKTSTATAKRYQRLTGQSKIPILQKGISIRK